MKNHIFSRKFNIFESVMTHLCRQFSAAVPMYKALNCTWSESWVTIVSIVPSASYFEAVQSKKKAANWWYFFPSNSLRFCRPSLYTNDVTPAHKNTDSRAFWRNITDHFEDIQRIFKDIGQFSKLIFSKYIPLIF